MLTDPELASMRRTATSAMPGTAVIQSGTLTSDGGGGFSEGFTTSGTVACRIAPINGDETQIGGRISADAEWIITLPALTPIETDDQVVVDTRTYNVLHVPERSWEVSRRIEAKEVT